MLMNCQWSIGYSEGRGARQGARGLQDRRWLVQRILTAVT